MTQFNIDKRAKLDLLNLDNDLINYKIESYFNSKFIVEYEDIKYSFCFLKTEVILLEIINADIKHVYTKDYKELLTDTFLIDLLRIENLPFRVYRYKKIGIDRLRKQIADELYIGEFFSQNNYAVWKKYNLRFKISKNLKLTNGN